MNTSRMPVSPVPTRPAESFGLFAIIESKRVILPLKGVECDFTVASGVAEVSLTQIFRQENEKPLDCEYLFPLPADASAYFCEADINGRTIRAQVRERQEARRLATEKKAAGFRTALVEAERENLFTLNLGNIQPGDLVSIQVKYFQTLRSLAGRPSLEVPFCPGIRYIPGKPLLRSNQGKGVVDDTDEVPDASRLTPVRIDAEHPDAAYVEVRGRLDGRWVEEVVSPSHPIVVQRAGEELRVSLSDKGDVPDRDFVLRWRERNVEAVTSRAWVREKDQEHYALLEIRAPKQAPAERAPVDFYFLVDRSGSMSGEKWNKAAEALLSCVQVLGPADRVMATFFESRFQDFAEKPQPAADLLSDPRFQKIKKLGTGGGTEMRPALQHVLQVAARHSEGRPRNLILITDAQIGNESAILELMKTAPGLAVHCFGIDVALNDSLLLALCRQQGGTFHSLNPRDDIQQAVTALGQTLGQPVLLDLQLPAGWELADAVIPNLYAGQIHYLSARSANGGPLQLTARNAAAQPVSILFETQAVSLEAPYLHWCRSRIQRLVAEGNAGAAVALSVQSNLICPLTAFIAWDEAEKVPVATDHLVQPVMEFACGAGAVQGLYEMTRELAQPHAAPAPGANVFAKRSRGLGLFRRLFQVPEPFVPTPPPVLDEVQLKRELSDCCHRGGLADWEPLVKAIFDWVAEVKGSERLARLEAVNRLLDQIKVETSRVEELRSPQAQPEAADARARTQQLLKDFVDKLPVRR